MHDQPETKSDRAPRRTYQGGCLCGTVRFHVEIAWQDHDDGRASASVWEQTVDPFGLRIVRGESALSGLQLTESGPVDFFCEQCGVRVYSRHLPIFGQPVHCSLDIKLLERPIARLEPACPDGALTSWARDVLRRASARSCRAR